MAGEREIRGESASQGCGDTGGSLPAANLEALQAPSFRAEAATGRCQGWTSGGALICVCTPPCPDEPRCECSGVETGSYSAQVLVLSPWDGAVGIDRCVLPEVTRLWSLGIRTIESCCGHGQAEGYIAVAPEHHEQMSRLGYAPASHAPHVHAWPPKAPPSRLAAGSQPQASQPIRDEQ